MPLRAKLSRPIFPPPAAPPPARASAAYIPPAVAAVYNWGGIYCGFNLGFGFGTSNWSDPLNISGVTSTGNFNLTGFLVGVEASWTASAIGGA